MNLNQRNPKRALASNGCQALRLMISPQEIGSVDTLVPRLEAVRHEFKISRNHQEQDRLYGSKHVVRDRCELAFCVHNSIVTIQKYGCAVHEKGSKSTEEELLIHVHIVNELVRRSRSPCLTSDQVAGDLMLRRNRRRERPA